MVPCRWLRSRDKDPVKFSQPSRPVGPSPMKPLAFAGRGAPAAVTSMSTPESFFGDLHADAAMPMIRALCLSSIFLLFQAGFSNQVVPALSCR